MAAPVLAFAAFHRRRISVRLAIAAVAFVMALLAVAGIAFTVYGDK
jgi:hypothetical protein